MTRSADPAGWSDRARCRDVDPDLFFPIGSTAAARLQAMEAKAVCRACPVATPCLDAAMSTAAAYGVWGGLDADERADLRRGRRRLTGRDQTPRIPYDREVLNPTW